jgi:hydroxyethylthiazole kinase-like uncharacterized protein yjeF
MSEPLYTVAELRALEAAAQACLPPGELMQRAGVAAAAAVAATLPAQGARALVVCGPGNNGGDGYVCALELARRGVEASCVALAAPATEDARQARHRWEESEGATLPELPASGGFDALVDAMFGIGMARPLAGAFLEAAQRLNDARAPVFAIDVPSGLDADRGCWVGGVAGVKAATTITFIGAKPGLFTAEGCDAAGTVRVEPIGVAPGLHTGALLGPDDCGSLLRPRPRNTHKGSYGSVVIVGGNVGMVGAPLLAARAALRLGAGRVYVDCIGAPDLRLDPLQPELMFRSLAGLDGLTACVVGCGIGANDRARAALEQALDGSWPLVVDADALNLLAADPALSQRCRGRNSPTVLTPHPLEAARLLECDVRSVQGDRVEAARALARRFGAIAVLKGAGSVVAGVDGYAISPAGSPALATAGTGDVLAGMIGAFLGQTGDPREAVQAAVWLHGAAAGEYGADIGLVAGDIAMLAARLLARLRSGR